MRRRDGRIPRRRKAFGKVRRKMCIRDRVSAVQSALNAFNKKLLSNHIKTCVVYEIREGDEQVVDELCETIQKLMK